MPLFVSSGADAELSESALGLLEIRAASIRGLQHRSAGTERQDAFSVTWDEDSQTLLVLVADGVGSLPDSRLASTRATELGQKLWREGFRDLPELVREINASVVDLARESATKSMATTLTALTIGVCEAGGFDLARCSIGDSPIWILQNSEWTLWSPDGDVDESFSAPITAIPFAEAAVNVQSQLISHGAVFVMTDGVGTPLQLSPDVRLSLAAWWESPPNLFEFGSQVSFARRSFIDDRTVVGVWLGGSGRIPEPTA
ncbi:protein phosphatase 2C domain-containing protein [Subtercola boreus]|uniref:protein phosphatase 2C domain-containing protein n=1 Tax=Subtercola boreus TaxID=120213 RepID=UPI001559F832|nr:protein phosphatase 2C domain-containing protein [Subtercola boreus]